MLEEKKNKNKKKELYYIESFGKTAVNANVYKTKTALFDLVK